MTKENNISLSRYTTDSFPSDKVETVDEHNISLMIEGEETTPKNTNGNLKDTDLFLLNDEIQSKKDEQNEKISQIGSMKKLYSNVINGAV